MNTELFTVSRIFTESLYRIPDYQRGYSWRVDQLKDFWLDLEQLQGDGKHYMGVLTLEDTQETKWLTWEADRWIIKSRRYKPYYVVDGQQRITTVIILLQCILEHAGSSQLNFTPIQDIRRKYVYDSKPEESSRSYIFGYERDNPSYEYLKKRIFCEQSDRHAPDEETIYTKNLIAAKNFFSELLKKMSTTQVELLFTKVTQQLVFNVYEISTDIDVFVTFETMNNRGKPLSTLELLKNRLIFLSTKIPSDNGDGPDLRRIVNDAWKTVYHYLGKNDARLLDDDEFLRTHLAIYYPTIVRGLPDRADESYTKAFSRYVYTLEYFNRFLLNDLFTPKRLSNSTSKSSDYPALTRQFIHDYARNLKTAVEMYFKLSTPAQSSFTDSEKLHLERIGRLRGYSPSSFMVAFFMKESDSKKRQVLLEKYERMLFCQSLTTRASYQYGRRIQTPDYYLDFISGRTSTADLITQFQNVVSETFNETSASEVIHEWVKNGPSYYGWRSIKYFLYEYEVEVKQRTKADRDKLDWAIFMTESYSDDYETIEHIYPQTARHKYWTERFSKFSSTQKRLLRNSLGNLLPLAKPRNSSLGNKSFPEKLGDENTMTGYRYGSYAEIEVAQLSEWGPIQIQNRGIKLLEFLERRWQISIGDESQKIRALGLDFLKRS